MKHPPVTVILPTYNEAENIIPLIRAIQKYTPEGTDILVVDDNSPDGTAGRVRQFIKSHKVQTHVNLLVRTANRGLTNSLKAGITESKSDIVVWMDCDFSHPPEVMPRLLQAIKNGADIATATRFRDMAKQNRENATQTKLTSGLNTALSLFFGANITDYTTGFLAVRQTVLDQIPLRGNYGEYCIDLLVRAKGLGYRIEEIPYASPQRIHGESKTAPDLTTFIRHGYGYISTFLRLFWTIKILQNPAL